ncbi:hypothetical protein RMSM_06705 [Rhodopirellula maiorica SM1]|uniref:Uncharacterized protein n=1 Tax=Rhodopirellula maiorica SM1 TaxID=1265738 RepID=M5RLV9_9BACT|nr:hypothetical protein RMSM_06705 [Rhodopirellula maiorica SM1]
MQPFSTHSRADASGPNRMKTDRKPQWPWDPFLIFSSETLP